MILLVDAEVGDSILMLLVPLWALAMDNWTRRGDVLDQARVGGKKAGINIDGNDISADFLGMNCCNGFVGCKFKYLQEGCEKRSQETRFWCYAVSCS